MGSDTSRLSGVSIVSVRWGMKTNRLNPDRLYLGDNGRLFCGTLAHAGMTAFFSGRDVSGQRVHAVPVSGIGEHMAVTWRRLQCEGCRQERLARDCQPKMDAVEEG